MREGFYLVGISWHFKRDADVNQSLHADSQRHPGRILVVLPEKCQDANHGTETDEAHN